MMPASSATPRRGVIPYLLVRDAGRALAFYELAFGARERVRLPGADERIVHAELDFDGAPVWLAEEAPELGAPGPQSLGGAGVGLFVYVGDVDAAMARALDAGARVVHPLRDQFWGDRTGTIADPFGHVWTLATCRQPLSLVEVLARAAAQRVAVTTAGNPARHHPPASPS